ncbi:interferon gamma receptor 1 [Discoglossus pictus]
MTGWWSPLHRYMAVAAVYFLTLILPLTPAEGKPTQQPHAVAAPFNLIIESYNFNTTLYWDYKDSSATHFQVEIRDYSKTINWTLVKRCKNIIHNYCDLSEEIVNPDTLYYVRVKAIGGSKESNYSVKEVSLRTDGKIGPPRLEVTLKDNTIEVDIFHPLVPQISSKKTVADYYTDFDYKVFFRNSTEHQAEDLDNVMKHTAYFAASSKDELYCFAAQGWSEEWALIGEKSEEVCIFVPDEEATKSLKTKIVVAIVLGIFFIIVIILSIIFIKYELILKTSKLLPKSLNPIKNIKTAVMETPNQEAKYDRISTSGMDIIEEKKSYMEDENFNMETADTSETGQTNGYPGYPGPLVETEEEKSDSNNTESCVDDLHSTSKITEYFHTGDHEHGADSGTLLESSTEVKEPDPEPKPHASSYGYDKPLVPLHMIIQMNKEEYGIDPLPVNN